MSLPLFSEKVQAEISVNHPNLLPLVSPALKVMRYFEVKNYYFRQIDITEWSGTGASNKVINTRITDLILSSDVNKNIKVYSASGLINAIKTAQSGETIILAPGEYHLGVSRVVTGKSGTESLPIHLTAQVLGEVKIFLKGEGIVVNKPYWQFSNLHFIGGCKRHTQCEHAFHVVGKGHHTVIKNNILQDFNAMIKVNGFGEHYPDYGQVTHNTFFNSTPRNTTNPVTPFDLMHANYWQVSDNFIFDIQKSGGNKVSYAAFFKGGSEYGVFERNLVMCAANLPDDYTALGLSLGGGGSLKRDRRNQNSAEHIGGIIRNNIIMHCSNDVGIYVNRSRNSLIEHNILYNTLGIDIRYPESEAYVSNNIISGRIKIRDSAKLIQHNNWVVNRDFISDKDSFTDYFVAPDIGNFTWKATFDNNRPVNLGGIPSATYKSSLAVDFCGALPQQQYVGAYSATRFCLDKLNINNSAGIESEE
jgi:hypothetical protein